MKNLIVLIICALFSNVMMAQLMENKVPMSKGNQNAFLFDLPNEEAKELEKAWSKYMKKFDGKTKRDKKTGEYFTDNAEIKNMSSNTVDVYCKVIQKGKDCQMVVWYDLGGAYLKSNTHPDAYAAARDMLENFQISTRISSTEDLLKDEESKLKKLNKEYSGLKKDKEGYENDIVKYEKKIAEAKQKIQKNIIEQDNKNGEIKKQGDIVGDVKSKLKKLEKMKK